MKQFFWRMLLRFLDPRTLENQNYTRSVIGRWGHEFNRGPTETMTVIDQYGMTSGGWAKPTPISCQRCGITLLDVLGPCPELLKHLNGGSR